MGSKVNFLIILLANIEAWFSGAEEGGDAEGEQHPHHGGHVQVWRINSDLVIILIVRKVRESRQELRKYMREVKKSNPSVVCSLQ